MSVARPSYVMSINVRQTLRVTIPSTLAQRIALAALAIFLMLKP